MLAASTDWRLAALLVAVFALLLGNSDRADSKELAVGSAPASRSRARSRGFLIGQQALDEWREKFEARSIANWRRLWNVEKHRRCYSDLQNHMEWFCRSGLSVGKRSGRRPGLFGRSAGLHRTPTAFLYAIRKVEHEPDDSDSLDDGYHEEGRFGPYGQPAAQALQLLKQTSGGRRKRRELGIMDECCHASDGCSWEEYAEYCDGGGRERRRLVPLASN